MAEAAKAKNQSEVSFEKYLKDHGMTQWDYEPEVAGKSHRLDYRFVYKGVPHFFDAKEFREEDREKELQEDEGGAFDPYSSIRKKIHGVREQFSEYKEFPCSLVLFNIDAALVFLDDWTIVMGAMLGDVGLRFSVDTSIGAAVGGFTSAFASRGKMINYKHLRPQNTTINALIALTNLPLGQRRLGYEFKRAETESKKKMSWEEFLHFAEGLKTNGIDAAETRLRVVVYENPYARIPLSRELFTGPYDERFGPDGNNIVRIFAGKEIQALEAEEAKFAT